MRKERPDFLLQSFIHQADQIKPIASTYAFGLLPRHSSEAANSPKYSETTRGVTDKLSSSVNKLAKIYQISLNFTKLASRWLRCLFRLYPAWILGFLASLASLTEGQNNHSPTMAYKIRTKTKKPLKFKGFFALTWRRGGDSNPRYLLQYA